MSIPAPVLENIRNHLISRGYVWKKKISLEENVYLEFLSPHGSSMMVGPCADPSGAQSSVYIKRKGLFGAAPASPIDRATLLNIIRESNGLLRVLILDRITRSAFLTSVSRLRPDNEQIIEGEAFDRSGTDADGDSPFRVIPVVTVEEMGVDEHACLRLCEKLSARLSAMMLRNMLDIQEKLSEASDKFLSLSCAYFDKHCALIDEVVPAAREHKMIAMSSSPTTDARDILGHREQQLELLHSHTFAIRKMYVAMQTFNEQIATYHAQL